MNGERVMFQLFFVCKKVYYRKCDDPCRKVVRIFSDENGNKCCLVPIY